MSIAFAVPVVCPPWFLYDGNITISSGPQQYSHCVCGKPLPLEIDCNREDFSSSLLSGNCAFWDNRTGRTVVGKCPYIFPQHLLEGRKMQLPQDVLTLNSWLCSHLNRETHSTVCGRCTNGTGPSVCSVGSECAPCRDVMSPHEKEREQEDAHPKTESHPTPSLHLCFSMCIILPTGQLNLNRCMQSAIG